MGYSDKTKQADFQNKWMHARRDAWIAGQGGTCSNCGSGDRLEVDHIDRGTKTMAASSIWSRAENVRAAELALCQVLCYGCHKAKTRSEFIVTEHGTAAMYNKRDCRCDECRTWNRDRVRRQRTATYARAA